MKTIFLDTSTINAIYEHGFDASFDNYTFVVGPYTTYELSKTKKEKRRKLFRLIELLRPSYLCQRAHLYKQEIERLVSGNAVAYLAGTLLKDAYDRRMSNPEFVEQLGFEKFIGQRETSNNSFRQQNYQSLCDNKRRLPVFSEFRNQYFSRPDLAIIVHHLITNTIKSTNLPLYIEKILQNLNDFPAHRTFIHAQLYLYHLSLSHGVIPARNRFSDGIQLIEASYSTVFASNDKPLLDIIPSINPDIEVMTFDRGNFIKIGYCGNYCDNGI